MASNNKEIFGVIGKLIAPFLGLLLVYIFFSILSPDLFPTLGNFRMVLTQTVIVALGALGMTMVIISAGIDLSVGSVMALSTVVIALFVEAGVPPIFSAAAGILAGGICGLLNGIIITGLRVVPFIVTLGMMGIARGLAKFLAHEEKVDAPITWLNDLMVRIPKPSWLIVNPGIWITLILAGATAFILHRTTFGRHLFAIGGNEPAARVCGVRVNRVKLIVYTLCGLFTGLAGLMLYARLSVGDPTVAVGKELDVIAAVVIGGGSLSGGAGSVVGTLVGALIMAFLRNGCDVVGWPNYVQEIIIGIIIISAVAVDSLRKKS